MTVAYPNHNRNFLGPEAAAPPADTPVPGGQVPDISISQVPERPPHLQLRYRHFHDSVGSSATGTIHAREELGGFEAKTAIIANTSGSVIKLACTDVRVPASTTNFVLRFFPYADHYTAEIFTSQTGAGELDVIFLEEALEPTQFFAAELSVGASISVSNFPNPQNIAAASLPQPTGAAHHAASQVTITAGVGSLAARATRTGGALYAKSTNAADIVVETTGFHIPPGGSLAITAVDLFSFTGTNGDLLYVYEEYN